MSILSALGSCDCSPGLLSAGTYNSATGASSSAACTDCGAGTYAAAAGASVCVECGAGKLPHPPGSEEEEEEEEEEVLFPAGSVSLGSSLLCVCVCARWHLGFCLSVGLGFPSIPPSEGRAGLECECSTACPSLAQSVSHNCVTAQCPHKPVS